MGLFRPLWLVGSVLGILALPEKKWNCQLKLRINKAKLIQLKPWQNNILLLRSKDPNVCDDKIVAIFCQLEKNPVIHKGPFKLIYIFFLQRRVSFAPVVSNIHTKWKMQ